jgi:hypothetical protein
MLDRLEERCRRPGVADVPQPHRPVRPVQQVRVALVGTQRLDEQPPPVLGDRRERPRAFGCAGGQTGPAGTPACRSATAIPSGPIRRSGTPNATSTAAPTVTPAATAMTSSIGRTVPVISRTAATTSSVIHAARRQGRLSQGDTALITAAAAAISAGQGNAALASHESRARLRTSTAGCGPLNSWRIPAVAAAATTAATASPASRRNRRWPSVAATARAAAATNATWTMPVSVRLTVLAPMPLVAGAAGPRSQRDAAGNHLDATAKAMTAQASTVPPAIRRITSPG